MSRISMWNDVYLLIPAVLTLQFPKFQATCAAKDMLLSRVEVMECCATLHGAAHYNPETIHHGFIRDTQLCVAICHLSLRLLGAQL